MGIDAIEWAKRCERRSARANCASTPSTPTEPSDGYELTLTRLICDAVRIPVIASGGAGSPQQVVDAVTEGRASAALIASIVHYGEYTIVAAQAIHGGSRRARPPDVVGMSGLTTGLVRRDLLIWSSGCGTVCTACSRSRHTPSIFPARPVRRNRNGCRTRESLLPLVRHGEPRRVHGPCARRRARDALLPSLPGIVDLCLENLSCTRPGG